MKQGGTLQLWPVDLTYQEIHFERVQHTTGHTSMLRRVIKVTRRVEVAARSRYEAWREAAQTHALKVPLVGPGANLISVQVGEPRPLQLERGASGRLTFWAGGKKRKA